MAELTMDVYGVLTHAIADAFGMDHTSLRQMGSSIGPHITQWYNEFFYRKASIIAVDYLNATGIVEVALEWNDRKFSPCYSIYVNLTKQHDIKKKLAIVSG